MKQLTIFVRKDGLADIYDNDTDERLTTCESEDDAVNHVECDLGFPGILGDYDIIYER